MHVIRRIRRSRRDDEGVVAVLVAILSVVLFGFGALVIDIGHAQVVRSQGQSTVDAASLAGVRVLANGGMPSDVVSAVQHYVDENMGVGLTAWAGCKDPTPLAVTDPTDTTDTCISMSTSPTPGITSYQVRVKLPTQNVPATFGGLFGVSSIGISPIAQALSGQPLPPACGPCNPALDDMTGQPTAQPPPAGLPASIRAMLPNPSLVAPDPDAVPPAGPVDAASGCPTTPGLFGTDNFPTGVVRIMNGYNCILKPGLYVFNNVDLDVQGNLNSYLAADPADPNVNDGPVLGVTLIFYGTATLTAENGGSITPLLSSLVTADTTANWVAGDAIPGVAIVIDEFDQTLTPSRTFSLGDDFDITGSVYALDGHTTWATNSGDCMPVTSTCAVHDEMGTQSVLATTTTAFADPDANGIGRIPTVATDHPMTEPPPSPPHLVK